MANVIEATKEEETAQFWFDKFTALKSGIKNLLADIENGNLNEDFSDNCEADADLGEWSAQSKISGKLEELIKEKN